MSSDLTTSGVWMEQERLRDKAVRDLVQAQRFPTNRALELRHFRRVSWSITADKLQRRFQSATDEAQRATPWERLYVTRDEATRSVRLFYGHHPVFGVAKNDKEIGASLVVSQEVLGGVAVFFFPFESINVQRAKPNLIWTYYDEPQQIHEAEIRRMLRDFFVYGRATSALMNPTPHERALAEKFEHRSRMLEGSAKPNGLHAAAIATLAVGSAVTAGLILAWISTEKASLEPWAGLAALATGWVAAWVERSRSVLDHRLSKAMKIEEITREERDRRLKERERATK